MDQAVAEEWIRSHVSPAGAVEVASEEPWATVLRVPLAGDGTAWFKACAPSRAFEARLTVRLAERWPDRMPEVLAADEERAWLLLADAGSSLGIGGGPEPWLEVLPAYAELQRGEARHVATHLEAGVPDRRLARFPACLEALVVVAPGVSPPESLLERCLELAAYGIPETVQHDDLHGGNVYVGRRTRVLDWGDACISHPLFAPWVTIAHLRTLEPDWVGRLRDAYLDPWGGGGEMRRAYELAQELAPYAHAFKEVMTLGELPEWVRPLL